MPLTRAEVDHHFTTVLIPMLPSIIRGISHKHNRMTDIDAAIAEAYLHMYKYIDTFEDTLQLDKLVKNWVKMNIIWTNSQLNKLQMVNSEVYTTNDNFDNLFDHEEDESTTSRKSEQAEDFSDLEDKIELELWYNNRKAQLELYRQQERDPVKAIIYDCFFKKGFTSGVALGKHLGVGRDSGARYIRELKKDLRTFANY